MKRVLILALILALSMSAAAMAVTYEGYTEAEFAALTKTTVVKSSDSRTGYIATFRYFAPEAKRVRIRGEWSFATDRGSFYPMSDNIMPEDYEDGMFPMQVDQKDWPAFDMTLNEETGVWSYTIELPSGTWSYRFIEGGLDGAMLTDYTDAFVTTDPNNRPMEKELGEQNNSQVRIPFDASKQSADMSVQLPREDGQVGAVTYHIYEAVGVDSELKDDPAIAVYTPYGYDAERSEPYNVLYLSHGAGLESEMSWWNKGSVGNMTDNLIAEGVIEPFVIVLMNNYAVNFDYDNLTENIVPLVESTYHVRTDREGKAVAGFSMGGVYAHDQMVHHPEAFGYFGLFSGGLFSQEVADQTTYDAEALKGARIYLAAGSKEFGLLAIQRTSEKLTEYGISGYHNHVQTGGHDWPAIRQIYVDYVTNELFR